MKKTIYLLSIAFFLVASLHAQNAVPNGGFENWTSAVYENPQYFISSNPAAFFRYSAAYNVVKTTDSYHGNYAVKLTTNVGSDTNMAYMMNASNPNGNNPCQWAGGIPYNQKPTGLHGYYKSNVVAGDSAGILVAFKNSGNCLGFYMLKFYGVHNTYTPFTLSFTTPMMSGTPDTIIFAAVSSDVFDNIQKNGSMLQLDSLSFTGVASQPADFNGDFENWTSQTLNKPNNWYLQTDDQGDGIFETTDAKAGTYAIELKTFLGDNGNGSVKHPIAQSAGISTGYQLNNCNGPNCQKGGNPFTNQIDTLTFYYKYVPSGNDTAGVSVNFKKNGNATGMMGISLLASANYKYVEIPFNTMGAIDSIIVSFQSSSWRDSALSFIGSDLKIDEVYFKSQAPAGIKNYDDNENITVFPNPSNGTFTLSNIKTHDLIRVYNVYGQEINAGIIKDAKAAHVQINMPGAYFIYINSGGKITSQKIMVL